jgi:hypothetical protein
MAIKSMAPQPEERVEIRSLFLFGWRLTSSPLVVLLNFYFTGLPVLSARSARMSSRAAQTAFSVLRSG